MNSFRVSSSHSTSVLRKLVTNPLMWLNGSLSSCAVAARMSSVLGMTDSKTLDTSTSLNE